jgi:hypothetical protein
MNLLGVEGMVLSSNQGSLKFPQLALLVPTPPEAATTCGN